MNSKRTLFLFAVGIVSSLIFAVLATAQTSDSNADKLLGSWNAQVTVEAQAVTFPALLTFDAGGGLIADEPPAPGETAGHGNWVISDDGEAAFTFVALYSGEGGAYAGKLKVVSKLQYDAGTDSWQGPFKIEAFDAEDQVTFSDTGTFDLTHMEVESLD
jgi:hypothetical protein